MLNIFKKKNEDIEIKTDKLTWEPQATQALEQAIGQTPVPAALKGTIRKKMTKAAEDQAKKANRTTVTAQDLMEGLLSQLPANMRDKVEKAAKQGPAGLKNLKKDLKDS